MQIEEHQLEKFLIDLNLVSKEELEKAKNKAERKKTALEKILLQD